MLHSNNRSKKSRFQTGITADCRSAILLWWTTITQTVIGFTVVYSRTVWTCNYTIGWVGDNLLFSLWFWPTMLWYNEVPGKVPSLILGKKRGPNQGSEEALWVGLIGDAVGRGAPVWKVVVLVGWVPHFPIVCPRDEHKAPAEDLPVVNCGRNHSFTIRLRPN